LEAGALKCRQIEQLRFRGLGVYIVAVGDMTCEMMTSGRDQCFIQAQALRFRDAPRRDPFAADIIEVHERLLQDRHCDSRPRKHSRKRAATDSRANDYNLGVSVCFHADGARWFTEEGTWNSECASSAASQRADRRSSLSPRSAIEPRYSSLASGLDSCRCGNLSSIDSIAIAPSRRASGAPRQKWIPSPKDTCSLGSRAMSNCSGCGKCAGSRLAAASRMKARLPAGISAPPTLVAAVGTRRVIWTGGS